MFRIKKEYIYKMINKIDSLSDEREELARK